MHDDKQFGSAAGDFVIGLDQKSPQLFFQTGRLDELR